jgi:hypothetical protein
MVLRRKYWLAWLDIRPILPEEYLWLVFSPDLFL